ncbi:MAG: DUF533 domain-containing protein [Rhodanobacteraceae bacterium]
MLDAERLLGNLVTGTLSQALGGRGSRLLRTGSIGTKAHLGIGLLGLAIAAYEHYSQQQPSVAPASGSRPPPPPGSKLPPPPPPPSATSDRNADAIVLIRAMIAAAQCDGRLDDDERTRILAATEGLSQTERTFVERELAAPQSIEQIAAASRPAIAPDVYTAAAHAIVADSDAEHLWLARLGDALGLDECARRSIEQRLASS